MKAYQIRNGKKVYVKQSKAMYFVLKTNKKYTNPKSVQISRKTLTLKKGKKKKLTVNVTGENRSKKLLKNSQIKIVRWYSSNSEIVKVQSSGIVKAKKKGSCKVYAVGANGVRKSVKIVVK